MKKNIWFICVLALVAIPFIGFANGGQEKDGVITLKALHYLDLADDVEANNFQALIDEFERQHPNIKLDFEFLVNEPYHNKLQTLNVANELPDVMLIWPGERSSNVTESGKIKDLRPWLKGHENEFAASALAPQGPNGEIYELPQQITVTHVMFVNTKILDKLKLSIPKTMNELIAQAKTINAAGYITLAMDNKDAWEMQSILLSTLVERVAGKDWILDAKKGKVSFSDPEFVRALSIIKELNDKKVFSPGINQAEYGRALTAFNTGKAAYLLDGGWRTPGIVGEMSKEDQAFVVFETFPDIPNQKGKSGSASVVAGTGIGMNANLEGAKADAAWEWIWFFSGPEGSKIKQTQGWLPAYKLPPTSDTPELQKKLAQFLAEKPGAYVIDAVMSAEGMGLLQTGIQQMMLGGKTPQKVADEYEAWVAANER